MLSRQIAAASPRLLCGILMVMGCQLNTMSAAEPLHSRIDKLIADIQVGPQAATCTDAEFMRRATRDLTGTIPPADAVRAFLDETSPDKRTTLVDRLINSPRYAWHMANMFGVDDRLGALREGFIANLVVADGDLLAEDTEVKMVFVDGQRF